MEKVGLNDNFEIGNDTKIPDSPTLRLFPLSQMIPPSFSSSSLCSFVSFRVYTVADGVRAYITRRANIFFQASSKACVYNVCLLHEISKKIAVFIRTMSRNRLSLMPGRINHGDDADKRERLTQAVVSAVR